MPKEQSFEQIDQGTKFPDSPISSGITRRQMLRKLATTSAVLGGLSLAGGGVLTACGGTAQSDTSPVTLLLGKWPFNVLPGTIKQDEYKKTDIQSITDVALVETLQDWLKLNKNVTLKSTQVIDDATTSQKVIAAIAARTAPALYGTFGDPNKDDSAINHFAVELGYAADPTDLLQQFKADSLLADYALPLWHATKNGEGHYFGLPSDNVSAGNGLFYRRDLAKQKGLAEPQLDWTWDDFRTFAKAMRTPGKPALGVPPYMIGYLLNSNMLDPLSASGLLGSVPAPNSNWHEQVKLDPWFNEWVDRAGFYRAMVFEDKLFEQNPTAYSWEGPASAKMADGTYPLAPGLFDLLSFGGYAPLTINEMGTHYGKPLDEMVAYITYPHGSNGAYNPSITPSMSATLVNPHLKGRALTMTASLWFYMFFGDGYVDSRYRRYQKTKNAADLYDYIAPSNKFRQNPKAPASATVESVYGKLADDYMAILKTAPIPTISQYIKPDRQAAPAGDAHGDMLQKLSMTQDDVVTILKNFQNTYNQETSSLTSSISSSDYAAGAKKFYKDMGAFWQKTAPTFYQSDWSTFYNQEIVPILGS